MKKLLLILVVFIVIGLAYLIYSKVNQTRDSAVTYSEVMHNSGSTLLTASNAIIEKQTLTSMLETGISTDAGTVKSTKLDAVKGVEQYSLVVNDKPTGIATVSPIELVKAFIVNDKQVILISYDQGGNQCSKQYQMITLTEPLQISKPFGTCLPINNILEERQSVTLSMPQSNPYLGDDVIISYRYSNGQINQLNHPKNADLKKKYAGMSATRILQVAAKDGCYQDGVMLDDNSCGNGLKYCTMFKNIPKNVKNSDYRFLADFCAQP